MHKDWMEKSYKLAVVDSGKLDCGQFGFVFFLFLCFFVHLCFYKEHLLHLLYNETDFNY